MAKQQRTKSEVLVGLMTRKQGATMAQMQAAIRRESFISLGRHVPKGMRLTVEDGRYRLVPRGKAPARKPQAETRAQV